LIVNSRCELIIDKSTGKEVNNNKALNYILFHMNDFPLQTLAVDVMVKDEVRFVDYLEIDEELDMYGVLGKTNRVLSKELINLLTK